MGPIDAEDFQSGWVSGDGDWRAIVAVAAITRGDDGAKVIKE
jgi:hypothetical protein